MRYHLISSDIGRAAIEDGEWTPDFTAYESGDVQFYADDDGPVAYVRFDDGDPSGIAFFETRYHGNGIGAAIIADIRAERPDLYISGDIDNADCARFWTRLGFDVDGVQIVRE